MCSARVAEAASKHRGVGRLPLHYAVFYDQPSVAVVQYLLEVFRQGAEVPDVYGRLPLHYAGNAVRDECLNMKGMCCNGGWMLTCLDVVII